MARRKIIKFNPLERERQSEDVLTFMTVDGLSLRKAALKAGLTAQTFLYWCDEDSILAERYGRAREAMIEKLADETVEIADEPVRLTPTGTTDSGAVQKQRLRVDTRKWLLSKLSPKKYGERMQAEHSGTMTVQWLSSSDADKPIV